MKLGKRPKKGRLSLAFLLKPGAPSAYAQKVSRREAVSSRLLHRKIARATERNLLKRWHVRRGLKMQMSVQSGYGVLSYQGADRVGVSKLGAPTMRSTPVDAARGQGSNASTTQVSISEAARTLASQEGATTQGRTAIQEKLLNSATSDPQSAEKLAYDMANTPSTIFYDIRDQLASGTMGPVNKLSSGRIVDEAFKENFSKEAAVIDAQRKALYESENAKGTPADQILAKLFDFTNAQSKDYLEASGWLGSVGGKTA